MIRAAAVGVTVLGVLSGTPATAAPSPPAVEITSVQPSVGRVEFLVAARDLPTGATLDAARITATAGGVPLTVTVRPPAADGAAAAASAVVLVVDVSGSMAGARIAAARAAAVDYAGAAPASVSLGLVTVADRAAVVLEPTADRSAFRAAVGRLVAAGETALYDGVETAVDLLDPKETPASARFLERRVVVLSDGADTASRISAAELTERLGRRAPTVDAVAFGGGADSVTLAALCGATGGRVAAASDAAALRSALRSMAGRLSPPVMVSAAVPAELAGTTGTLRVRAVAGGADLVAEVPVAFRPDPAAVPARPSFTVPAGAGAGRGPVVLIGVVAVALFGLVIVLIRPAGRGDAVRRRLGELDRFTAGSSRAAGAAAGGGHVLRAALAVSEQTVARPDHRERVELALDRAGLALRAAEWQLVRLGCALAGAAGLTVALPWWCGVPLGLVAGWAAAGGYLRWRAGRRARAFADQLPDALQLVVGSLRSGFSLAQAVDALVREGGSPVADELGRALAETRLGGDLEDALDGVGRRNASQDVGWLVMAIRIQREVGGNLSEVLETAVNTMRERGRLGRHVRALSAEGRLSAMILLAMPILLGGWMFAFRRDYLRPLYTEPLGILMLGTAVVLVLAGGLWLRKLVQVRV